MINEIIYIGEDFYWKSKTMMSSIYMLLGDEVVRCDWGKVGLMLARGEKLFMRKATEKEMEGFKRMLKDFEEDKP